MKKSLKLIASIAPLTALAGLMAFGAEPATPARPEIEVCFVLDTTGSMSGLIEGAKRKIWSIANDIASAKPTPNVKMGLIGYRDRGDKYVTKVYDLTDNIDVDLRGTAEVQSRWRRGHPGIGQPGPCTKPPPR